MVAVLFRAVLIAAMIVSAHAMRTCSRCTFENTDATVRACVMCVKYLACHERRLKQNILELDDKQTGEGKMRVTLADSSVRRASRGARQPFGSSLEEFNAALDDVADLAHDIHEKINVRLMNTDAEERWVRRMEVALDLRVMAYPTGDLGRTALATAIAASLRLTSIGLPASG